MRRFVGDESGVTMGLVVIMIVLIGVMGAGLLTFTSRQLASVVEVSQGQRALEAADAGLQVARQHLATEEARPSRYDTVVLSDNSEWYAGGFTTGGKTVSFDGDQIWIGIAGASSGHPEDSVGYLDGRFKGFTWQIEVIPS